MTTELKPCQASPDCLHRPCRECGEPMRVSNSYAADHPGAIRHRRGGTCNACSWHEVPLLPQDLQDQRHILLSDAEMEHIMFEHPTAFTWHAERRKRLRLGEYS